MKSHTCTNLSVRPFPTDNCSACRGTGTNIDEPDPSPAAPPDGLPLTDEAGRRAS
jgi:hypothetical protein